MFNLSKKDFRKIDYILLITLISLVVFGLVVLNSAFTPLEQTIRSQVFATVIGIVLMVFIFALDLEFIYKTKWIIYFFSCSLLIATILFGTGGESWGANLWLRIGPVQLQPSEISKVLHILFLSSYIGENRKKINTLNFILKYLALGFFPVALIIFQQDIGTALVVAFITSVMFFLSGISWKNISKIFAIGFVLFLLALPLIWSRLGDYAKDRILDFSNQDRNLQTSTHQTDRGLIALGSGQLTGRGYQKGPYTQNRYIPEHQTDFIFPVLVEEFGFIGGITAIALFFILFLRLLIISGRAESIYHSTLVIGVFSLLFVHIFENMGMTMGIMPVTGIPLPFFSHGGTFQLINLILMGLCLSVSMERRSLEF